MIPRSQADRARAGWAIGCVLLFGVEAAGFTPESSPLRTVAAWTWVALSLLALLASVLEAIYSLARKGPDAGWYAVALLFPVVLLAYGITGYTHTQINLEAVHQVNEGLARIASRRDLGLFGSAFLGYPGRQYLLAALPSLWWGRHLVTLRLGYGLFYVMGYWAFVAGTAAYLQGRTSRPRLLASLAGLLVSLGSYPLLYARLFEQTVMPLAITLLFFGSLLLFLPGRRPVAALVVAWALGLMPYAYTPALATWVLALAILTMLLVRSPAAERRILLATAIYGLATLAASILWRGPSSSLPSLLEVGHYIAGGSAGFADASLGARVLRLVIGFHAVAGMEESLLPPPLTIGVLLILFDSLRRRDGRILALCAWAGLVIVAALVLKGYWQRVPEFDLQRAMVVLPPLSLAVVLYLVQRSETFAVVGVARVIPCVLAFMILNAVALPWLRRTPRQYFPFAVSDLEEITQLAIDQGGDRPAAIYVATPLDFPLEMTLAYFRPETRVIHGRPPPGEHRPDTYVISYTGDEPFVGEDPLARPEEYPVRFGHPRPYYSIRPE